MVNFLLFGPPGSGKGTQSLKLAGEFNLIHLSTGDMLREAIDSGTELGKKVSGMMEKGELVPDDIVIAMISEEIDSHPDSGGFIFDGFPRTVKQAVALDETLAEKDTTVCRMLVLEVEHDELVKRLLARAEESGRPDDKCESVVENRINVYREKTEPVINYYKKQGKYLPVNGMGDIDEIFKRLCKVIEVCM